MRIAVVHALPLEYYPPARNTLGLLSRHKTWEVRAWSTTNRRGLADWHPGRFPIVRHWHADPDDPLPLRIAGYSGWHARTALDLVRWKPDALIYFEPHSALAVWSYFRLGGNAELFIHHHEYYAPEDYLRPGMRMVRSTMKLERRALFARARWVSQTNEVRLRLMLEWSREVRRESARVFPNYPPADWLDRSKRAEAAPMAKAPTKLVYVGAASIEDTFIQQAIEFAARNPGRFSLHLCGDNIQDAVWNLVDSLGAPNITSDRNGVPYDSIPEMLAGFDTGLILYKGNTLNFVHNVPNKAIEYLVCGLEVWYPPVMVGMSEFHRTHPLMPLREVDFTSLSHPPASRLCRAPHADLRQLTCERATQPLIDDLESLAERRTK